MATLSYPDQSTPYAAAGTQAREATTHSAARRDIGATAFIWLAWALAAIFWAAVLSTAVHILGTPAPSASGPGPGGVDAAGAGFGLMTVVGVVVLGLAMAYAAFRYMGRDKRKDPITEASTAALYDSIERQGGEDMTTRSPEARESVERDAFRNANLHRP